YRTATSDRGRSGQARRCVSYQAQSQAADLQEAFGLTGPVTLVSNACASGANAIGHAWHLVRNAFADQVVAVVYEGLIQLFFAGFDSLQALSIAGCRPFDAHRDGLALGEGAAVFLVESLESAAQRGAKVLGEILGYGARTDLHHLTQPQPEGAAALAAMRQACAAGGLEPEAVDY